MEIGGGEEVRKRIELNKKRELDGCGKIEYCFNICMNIGL